MERRRTERALFEIYVFNGRLDQLNLGAVHIYDARLTAKIHDIGFVANAVRTHAAVTTPLNRDETEQSVGLNADMACSPGERVSD